MDKKKYTKIGILVTVIIVAIVLGIGGLIYSKVKNNDMGNDIQKIAKKENVKIRENEVRQLTLEDYSTDVFSMKKYKVFADAVVLNNPTTEGFYKKFGEISSYVNSIEPTLSSFKFPTFNSFIKQEEFDSTASMKNVALDSKVLRATFKGDNGKDGY